jgi:hypothetical protein
MTLSRLNKQKMPFQEDTQLVFSFTLSGRHMQCVFVVSYNKCDFGTDSTVCDENSKMKDYVNSTIQLM